MLNLKRVKAVALVAVLAMSGITAVASVDTVDWKGVTWDVYNGSAVVNGDDSLTLTYTGNGVSTDDRAWLHVNRLPWEGGTFDSVMNPSIQLGYEGHKGDIYIEQETGLEATVMAGSPWGGEMAIAYNGAWNNNGFFIYKQAPVDPISHVVDLGKRPDGTVFGRFDSEPWANTEFLKTNIGGDWGFNDVYLRLRGGTADETITFTDFQFGRFLEPTMELPVYTSTGTPEQQEAVVTAITAVEESVVRAPITVEQEAATPTGYSLLGDTEQTELDSAEVTALIAALDADGAGDTQQFVRLELAYDDAEIAALGIVETDLAPYWWNGTALVLVGTTIAGEEGIGTLATLEEHEDMVGYYGVDTDANIVWSNVNHASAYALGGEVTVPEPATMSLLAIGGIALLRRKRQK